MENALRNTTKVCTSKWQCFRICILATILLLCLWFSGLHDDVTGNPKASLEEREFYSDTKEGRKKEEDGNVVSKDHISENTNTPRKLLGEKQNQDRRSEEKKERTSKHTPNQGSSQNNRKLHWTIQLAGQYDDALFTPPPNETPKRRLPQAIIFGAGKCGTRALHNFLDMHPYIVGCGPEIHFFDRDENWEKGWSWYLSRMPVTYSNQITLEKTPAYYLSARAVEEIYKLNRNMKLIIILKDPVSRVMSQTLTSNNPDPTLRKYLIEQDGKLKVDDSMWTVYVGLYAKYLKMWYEKFQRKQIYVLEAEEFITHPLKVLQSLELFLDVPRRFTDTNIYFNATKDYYCPRQFYTEQIDCLGEMKGLPHPKLDPEVEKTFYEFYLRPNEELFKLLGRRFQWTPNRNKSL